MTAQLSFRLPATATRRAGHEWARDPFSDAELRDLRDRLWALAFGSSEFSADWFRSHLPTPLRIKVDAHPNIVGMLFTEASESGMLVDTGRTVKSALKSARGRKITLWRKADPWPNTK